MILKLLKMKRIIYLYILLFPSIVFAQRREAEVAFNGYKGNYIFNLFKPASAQHPDGEVIGFRLDRKLITEPNWQVLSKFESPSNYNDLEKQYESAKSKAFEYVPENEYSVNEIWPIYKKTFTYDSLSIYLTQQSLALACNLLLIDTTANPSLTYQYKVVQLKKDGTEYGNYTSTPVSNKNIINAYKPKSFSREIIGSVFRLTYKAKLSTEIPVALLVNRKLENENKFQRVLAKYAIEQQGDSLIYTVVDDQVSSNSLYQYTITPVNRFGGGGSVSSDTLSVNAMDKKMLLPKAFTAFVDSTKQQINLSWGFLKPELISLVKVYRSENYEDGYEYVGSTNQGAFADKSIVPGKKYYYYLTVSDNLGRSSERSTKIYALMQSIIKPTVPLYIEVAKGDKGNVISWQDYNLENRGYKIYRSNQIGGTLIPLGDYIYVDKKLEGKYSFIDTTKNVNEITGYAVTAESMSNLESEFSKIVYLKQATELKNLVAPNLLDYVKDKNTVRIFWQQDNQNFGLIGFNVYRKIDNSAFIKINKKPIDVSKSAFTDSLTINNQELSYRITAISLNGTETAASNELLVNFAGIVYAPKNLKSFYTTNNTAISLEWQPAQSTIAKYEIYRYTRGEEPVKIAEVKASAISYLDDKYQKGKNNYYYLVSVSANGKTSLPSNETYKVAGE